MNEILRSFQSPQAILLTEDKINTFRTTCAHFATIVKFQWFQWHHHH